MKQLLALTLSLALLAACGGTPAATEPPATQTPWIVVVTATPAGQGTSEAQQPATAVQPATAPRATATRAPATRTPEPTLAPTSVATATPAATAGPQVEASPVPSENPLTGTMRYAPPRLLLPPDEQPVSVGSTMLLRWAGVGELAEDEYYHVHLERRPRTAGQEWYGDYVFTKETEFRAETSFLAPFHMARHHGQATVFWWVWVVQKTGEDASGKPIGVDISPYSEERTLILDPAP